jgi:ABC-type bacteriocin/lantibiotic exporter with double-glycine peptidase domain
MFNFCSICFSRTVAIMLFGLRAAKRMHAGLLRRILGAPMSFFDQTPIGRIVSRFSKDMHQVSEFSY